MEQQRAREAAEREQGQAPLFQSNDHDNDFGSMGEFHLGLNGGGTLSSGFAPPRMEP